MTPASLRHARHSTALVAIVILAFLLRAGLALVHPFDFPDSADYLALGRALFHAQPYGAPGAQAVRMPGYPVFVALFGGIPMLVLLAQAALGAASCYLLYRLTRAVLPPERGETPALLAALLLTCDPLSVGFSAALLSEVPFTFFLLLALLLAVRMAREPRWYHWPLLGLTLGVATYLRASVLWLIVPLSAWLVIRRPRAVGGAAVALAVLFAALAPWQIRNYALFHADYFRLTTLEGISLYEAVYPQATGGPRQDLISLPEEAKPLNESQRNDYWQRRANQEIREHPGRVLLLAVRKIGRTWSPMFNPGAGEFFNRPWIQGLMLLWHIPTYVLAFRGLRCRWVPLQALVILLVPIVYFTLVHALYLGSVRYRVPLMPLVLLFSAVGLVNLLNYFANRRAGPGSNS